jgi:long-chain acyl-CoA synthetase
MTGDGSIATTLVQLWARRLEASNGQTDGTPALMAKFAGPQSEYQPLSWTEVADKVSAWAAALVELGVQPGDRVAMVAPNRWEWIITDLAILSARGVHVPIHASLSGSQILYQVRHSGARLLILAGAEQAAKLVDLADQLPEDLVLVSLDPLEQIIPGREILDYRKWMEQGAASPRREQLLAEAVTHTQPGDVATILYTSGTTGEPKGVMLSHSNLAINAQTIKRIIAIRPDDVRLTWLPLSHIFARTCDLYSWIVSGIPLAIADSPESVVANCQAIKPTLINGVPYFFDKLQRALVAQGADKQPGALQHLLGGRARMCSSGGAALPDHTYHFFSEQGVFISQGYGLTETSPVISTGLPDAFKVGTVGRPIDGVEVKIAEDGEILTRGPHVMLGYWQQPEATAEAIREGWFHTGDLGEIDSDGYLKITGRKKELIVTAAGKNIAPIYLEALLTADPLIDQAMVVGDARKFLSALVVVNTAGVMSEAAKLDLPPETIEEALQRLEVQQLFQQRVNERLKGVSKPEQVVKLALLKEPFTPQNGQLTITLKLRRKVIESDYADVIEAMYQD